MGFYSNYNFINLQLLSEHVMKQEHLHTLTSLFADLGCICVMVFTMMQTKENSPEFRDVKIGRPYREIRYRRIFNRDKILVITIRAFIRKWKKQGLSVKMHF